MADEAHAGHRRRVAVATVAVIVLGSTTMVAAHGVPARSLDRDFAVLKAHPTGPARQPGSAVMAGSASALGDVPTEVVNG
jgi:hypothetical protein